MLAQKLPLAAFCALFGRRPEKDFKQKHFGARFSAGFPLFLGVKKCPSFIY
jgi:hypothetical protein